MKQFSGTLALVGSGEYLPPMRPVDEWLLSQLREPPRVACLPTAAGQEGPERIGYWARMGVEHFTQLGAEAEAVGIIDRATAEDEACAARIRTANFVYLSGGKPEYLHNTLKGTRAWQAIEGVLNSGGVVAGCSAGAMIFGAHIPSFPTLWPLKPAFGYLPEVVIMPHFDEFSVMFATALKTVAGRATLVGIEGNTSLVCRAEGYTVRGSGGVTVWNARLKQRYISEESVPIV